MNIRLNNSRLLEFAAVTGVCTVMTVAFTFPWHPNSTSIPTVYQGKAEFFAKVDASMWTYMLAWGAKHPDKFYDAPVLMPVKNPLVANDPRLTEGIWSIPLFLFLPPVLAWGITLWLALVFTAVGCYYAGRIFTGSRWGGAAVTVLFSFGMFRANHVCHVEGIFVPFLALAFAMMVRFLEAPARMIMIGFALALAAAVIEYSYIAVPLGMTLPLVFLWGIWRRKIPLKQGILPLLLAGALAALILAPVALKYVSFHQAFGVKRHIMHVDSCSADLFAWITGPTGRILPPFGGEFEHIFVDPQLFPGFILLLSGLAGFCLLYRKSPEIIVIGIFAFLLSFGTMRFLFWQLGLPHSEIRTPYELLYDWLLPFKAIRAPARFGVLTHLALAFAGALMIAKLASSRNGKIFAVVLMMLSFFEARAGMHSVRILPERAGDPAYRWLAEQAGDFAVFEAPMGLVAVREQHIVEAETMFTSLVHGRRTPNGTLAADMPWHESIAVNTANPAHGEAKRLMRALGVRYVVTKDPETTERYEKAGYHKSYSSPSGISVFEVESPMSLPSGPTELAKRLEPDPLYMETHSGQKANAANFRVPARMELRKGSRFVMPILVRNSGQNTWAASSYIYGKEEKGDVFAGIRRWRRIDPEVGEIARGPRGEILGIAGYLPSNLSAGEITEMFVAGIAPIIPGRYIAEIDIGIRGAGWMSPPGRPVVTAEVMVK
ncbi:MAG: hypothetical protein PHR77_16310 [Kiritimatiellae bacterium]|nr:hypothetical protein [Kiritimatiellia bacterium]MDD5522586.1 hypothetical protein [Kiritimatiellia bacterium]